jgi:hypothetical protein
MTTLLRQPRRYFTPDEANAALPGVRARLAVLVEGLQKAQQLAGELERTASGRDVTMAEITELKRRVSVAMREIEREGVDVKGIQPGLLDFPALRDGVEVYLCWREGEERIEFWHPRHTGIRGRQKLEGDAGSWAWFD